MIDIKRISSEADVSMLYLISRYEPIPSIAFLVLWSICSGVCAGGWHEARSGVEMSMTIKINGTNNLDPMIHPIEYIPGWIISCSILVNAAL
jgi:hypothetical protein